MDALFVGTGRRGTWSCRGSSPTARRADRRRGRSCEARGSGDPGVARADAERVRALLTQAISRLDADAPCACQRALDPALLTLAEAIGPSVIARLHPLLARRFGGREALLQRVAV